MSDDSPDAMIIRNRNTTIITNATGPVNTGPETSPSATFSPSSTVKRGSRGFSTGGNGEAVDELATD